MNRETSMVYKYLIPLITRGESLFYLPYLPFRVRCRIAKKMARKDWKKQVIYTYNNYVIHTVLKPILRKKGKLKR